MIEAAAIAFFGVPGVFLAYALLGDFVVGMKRWLNRP